MPYTGLPDPSRRERQHPFQVLFLVACVTVGVVLIASGTRPRSVETAMPALIQAVWEIMLIAGGITGLVATGWRGSPATALAVELGALAILGSATTMYAIALVAVSGVAAAAAATFVGAFSTAAWWRVAQIVRVARRAGSGRPPPSTVA